MPTMRFDDPEILPVPEGWDALFRIEREAFVRQDAGVSKLLESFYAHF